MTQKIAKARLRAYNRQGGLCHYCGKPMILAGGGAGICDKAVPRDFLRRMACTAEHLIAKRDGGTNAFTNIVAACRFCNSTRHARKTPLPPEKYKQLVLKRLRGGHWHPHQIQCHFQN
ncbi:MULTISPECIES: HNH endonuclease [Polaromonas]|uniref:HNH endonuclease n=1 Tax=Polaromonas aquatica TaxID=332657 RepID=A0ABW1U1E2_9BURK